jgi:hypothetical protein
MKYRGVFLSRSNVHAMKKTQQRRKEKHVQASQRLLNEFLQKREISRRFVRQ